MNHYYWPKITLCNLIPYYLIFFTFSNWILLSFYMPIIINYYVKYSWQFYGLLIFEVVVFCNGIASPLIYAWHSEAFKQKILEMYGLRSPQTNDETTTHVNTISLNYVTVQEIE